MATEELTSLLSELEKYHLLTPDQLPQARALCDAAGQGPRQLAAELIRRGWLTPYQANQLLNGHADRLVLGPYVLLERLGQGAMGQVYKARHILLDRLVALKVLRPDLVDPSAALDRFRREIQATGRLTHPNVILAHDANQVGDTFFLVMEYVAGADLARLLKERGRIPPAEAADYIRQAALGLQHAHEHGLVHRDVKPSNLMVTAAGNVVKVLDLGLARLHVEKDVAAPLTCDGAIMGTPDYIAPEQIECARSADIRADIYSLGCTLYHLLTGQPPFPGGSIPQKLRKHEVAAPAPVETLCPEVAPGLALVVQKMMAKRPQDRHATPGEVADALTPFSRCAGGERALPPASAPEPGASTVDWSGRATHADSLDQGPRASRTRKPGRALKVGVLAGLVGVAGLVVLALLPVLLQRSRNLTQARAPEQGEPHSGPQNPGDAMSQVREGPRQPDHLPELPADNPGRLVKQLQGHTGRIRCLVFSPDGRRLASGADDNLALLWDARSGEQQGSALRHKHPVRALAWSPDSKRLAAGSWGGAYEGAVRLWSVDDPRDPQTLSLQDKVVTPSQADVRSLAFSPDGSRLASGGGPVHVWDLKKKDGKPTVRTWQETFPSYLYALAFSPDGKAIAGGCHEQGDSVRVWEVERSDDPILLRGKEQAFGLSHSDVFGTLAFAVGGKRFIRVTSSGRGFQDNAASVMVWDVDAPQLRFTLRETFTIPGGSVFALACAADGSLRVAVAEGPSRFPAGFAKDEEKSPGEVKLWDAATKDVRTLATAHKASITALAFSPDGTQLATGSEDQTVKLWSLGGR